MKSRIHSRPLSLGLAAVALWGLTIPTPGVAQSRQSGKPGSRASTPAPGTKAPSGRTAQPRAAAPRDNAGSKRRATAARTPESTRSRQRSKADSTSDRREQRIAPPEPARGRERGDRPATGVAVPRGPRAPVRPPQDVPRYYYRYPHYTYGYPFGYPFSYAYSPYDADYYLYDPFFWGFPGYGAGFGAGYGAGYDADSGYGFSGGGGGQSFDDGALRLKVKPRSADVFVDGYYVGTVDNFDGAFQRLKLEAGPHRIEIRQDGFQTLTFDVRIPSDETITYQGELQRQTP